MIFLDQGDKCGGNNVVDFSDVAKFLSFNGNTRITSFQVVIHCVGSAIFALIFVVVIAAAATIVALLAIATVVAFRFDVCVVVLLPPIVVFGGAFICIGILRRYCSLLLG